jgi:tRNA 2-selenouridine synthase
VGLSALSLFDVRSPAEYAKGHIPGAISLPLFSDEERAQVGTMYCQVGREEAIVLGMELLGAKVDWLFDAVGDEGGGSVYCWRGGMRSGVVGRLLGLDILEGGYKAYRARMRAEFEKVREWKVLGGCTGCGKTERLEELRAQGEQVLDLEGLAEHRGSAFGAIGKGPQPSQEQFENLIGGVLEGCDGPVWVEDESRMIGKLKLPDALYAQMSEAPLVLMEVGLEERLDRLMRDYGEAPRGELVAATERIRKKLGGERADRAVAAIEKGKLRDAFELILYYYDRTYHYAIEHRGAYV